MISLRTVCMILMCLISLPAIRVYAQEPSEVREMKEVMQIERSRPHYHFDNHHDSELKIFFTGLFLLYKQFISSQDGQHCSFTPSCSEYAIAGIRKHGMIAGLLNAFDRISRCNNLSPEWYSRDPGTKLLYDPL